MSTTSFCPRIWRTPRSDFYGDEPLTAPQAYTDEVFAGIRGHGFDGVWLRGKLAKLARTDALPELIDAQRGQRLEGMRAIIERGRPHGVGVWLFFNEPLALPRDDPFWQKYPQLQGEPFSHPLVAERTTSSLCTSTPRVKQFMREAIADLFAALPGLAGIILITASEYHTHCWSHVSRTATMEDGYGGRPTSPSCPRCREREPAEVVGELVTMWRDAAARVSPSPRVLAWNWSWSMWYAEPQAEVIEALPAGVGLMADWERGSARPWRGKEIFIDEYSLGFTGPSTRFLRSRQCARQRGLSMHTKLQLGTTHEIATVPNLPLVASLHGKLTGLTRHEVSGYMGCWNFGCGLTLNTFAFGLYAQDPPAFAAPERFFAELARRYFGLDDAEALSQAWRGFGAAFDNYPFNIPVLYHGPMNYAPAYALSPQFHDREMGPSWLVHDPWGDRLESCLHKFTLDEATAAFTDVARLWREHLPRYLQALLPDGSASEEQNHHRLEEARCATMIAHQLQSNAHIYRFHQWRRREMQRLNLTGPCTLVIDHHARSIIDAEIANTQAAIPLVESDPRMGFHQECQAYLYDVPRMTRKIEAMSAR